MGKKALIIGGGFAGCTAAHQLELLGGWDVLLVETAPFLGGGCKTFYQGGHPYTFGPRHFLTEMEDVFQYLNGIVPLRPCNEHLFWTYVEQDQAFYHYPIHMDDINKMPDRDKILAEMKNAPGPQGAKNLEEYWLKSVGETLYNKFVGDYNKKMWKIDDNRILDRNVENWSTKGPTIKSGPREVFHDWISAYPYAYNGYDDFFSYTTRNTKVLLKTKIESYDTKNKTVTIGGEKMTFDVIISSIPPDVLFEFAFGELKFIGRDFHTIIVPNEHIFPENVYFCYYANNNPVTRAVEYKKLTKHESPTSLLGIEIPSLKGRYYPFPTNAELEKAKLYFAEMPDGVFSIGRAGRYDYVSDIDDSIFDAMQVAKDLK